MKTALLVCAALAAGAAAAAAQQGPAPASAGVPRAGEADPFHAEIARLYRTEPDDFERRGGRERIAAELDAFWDRVKADRATYLPLLRAELARSDNPPFFYFDGAELLRDASESRADRELALRALERADLSRVELGGYLLALNWYVNNGYDTRRAALRWLDQPRDAEIVVTPFPHVFQYDRLEAMIFSLFGMDEERFVGDLVARVQTARDDFQIFYLLHCIWATATPAGRAALAAYADDESKPEAARRYAREMLSHRGDGPPPSESEEELRRMRRAVIANPFVHGGFERFHAITDELVKVAR